MPGRSGESDAATVARTLQAAAVPIPQLLKARELLPAAPGFYCCWSRQDAIARLPHLPHRFPTTHL